MVEFEIIKTSGRNLVDGQESAIDLFSMDENMEGVTARIPGIGIAHQHGFYTMPDESTAKTFEAIIFDHHAANAWWQHSFEDTGGGEFPDCFSMDGIRPDPNSLMVHGTCQGCPKNEFGTAVDDDGKPGRGKACKNMKRLHLILPHETIPHRLILPPSNIECADTFLSACLSKNLPHQLVPVTFSLKDASSATGILFQKVVIKPEIVKLKDGRNSFKFITDQAAQKTIRRYFDDWKPIVREEPIILDDMENEYAAGSGPQSAPDEPTF